MGLSGISIWQLLIILVIAVTIFGTKRLSTIGTDLGSAVRNFRKAMEQHDEEDKGVAPLDARVPRLEEKTSAPPPQ